MHVVLVVANLPVTRDRRVLRETRAHRDVGHQVTVISPRDSSSSPAPAELEGVRVLCFPNLVLGRSPFTWAVECLWSFMCVTVLLVRAAWCRVDVVQVCNPPDIFWPIAGVARLFGVGWVFDHHDLSPEMYDAKGGRSAFLRRVLVTSERLSMRTATAVIATNESFRQVALVRGDCPPRKVTVVRNGPSCTEVRPTNAPVPTQAPFTVAYVGVMGVQDGTDVVVRAARHLVGTLGRRDCRFVLLGDGEMLPALRQLVLRWGLEDFVMLQGWVGTTEVASLLRCAAVALQPDQPSPLNHLSTMAKTVEYLAYGVPVVAADLAETRASAEEAAVYLSVPTPEAFAEAIGLLVDDPKRRTEMSRRGRELVRERLGWEHQARRYLGVFAQLSPESAVEGAAAAAPSTDVVSTLRPVSTPFRPSTASRSRRRPADPS